MFDSAFHPDLPTRIGEKLFEINWGLIFFITLIACVGFAMLYSAADGSLDPWAERQMLRFAVGVLVLLVVAMIDLRVWMSLAYPAYGAALLLLVAVFLFGEIGKGSRRWLDLGPLTLQPSELMKIALILALARYFHGLNFAKLSNPLFLLPALAMIAAPAAFVGVQPDLGTAILIVAGGLGVVFVAGLQWRYIVGAGLAAASLVATFGEWFWNERLHDYQRLRIITMLDPMADPQGAGYQILQAKIALGSGGIWGKGFMQGTQSHLNFLPEQQTDFIFTMLAEEFGLMGSLFLLVLYIIVLGYGVAIALSSRSHFGRLVASGVTLNLFLYVAINTGMVMGVLPVVGVPLPLVSYGGTAMMTLMFGFGLLMSVHVHRQMEIPRSHSLLF